MIQEKKHMFSLNKHTHVIMWVCVDINICIVLKTTKIAVGLVIYV